MSSQDTPPEHSQGFRVVIAGLSGMAAAVILHPMELLKNRMQMTGIGVRVNKWERTTTCRVLNTVLREGPRSLYTGLSAAMLRTGSFTAARVGVYNYLVEKFQAEGHPPNPAMKGICGLLGGTAAAFIGCPAEVVLIRMTSDGHLPLWERRNYRNVAEAMCRIVRDEGARGLWSGVLASMERAAIVNGLQMATYSELLELFARSGYLCEGLACHCWASMASAVVTTVLSMPVDMAKTRLQNMKAGKKVEYTGVIDVLRQVIRKEGFTALWKGFTPYYIRTGPQTVLLFIYMDYFTWLHDLVKK